jgi:uncharacterized protein (TIGR02444 family)
MSDAGEEFWTFSLALYARPSVSPACLELQDRYGRDVNLVLYSCWIGASGRGVLAEADLAAAETVAAPWRGAVIEPLRTARRSLKGVAGAETLYAQVKALELEGERGAHRRLAALAPSPGAADRRERLAAAGASLARYLGAEAAPAAAPIVAALSDILEG